MSADELYAEPDPAKYAEHEQQLDAEASAEYDDFDAFWQAQHPVTPARIRGLTVTPPVDVPLALLDKLDRVQGSADMDAVKEVLADVFGAGVIDHWTAAGMGFREWQVVLAWAGAHMRGDRCTFAEAYEVVRAAQAEVEANGGGKAPTNRRSRRTAERGRTKSGAAGA